MTTADTTTLAHIQVAMVETCPFGESATYLGGPGTLYLLPEYEGLPESFEAAVRAVNDRPDAARCAGCDAPIGWVLSGDPERLHWEITGLARGGDGPVVALCEQCTPYVPDVA